MDYECATCQKKFPLKRTLKRHILEHAPENRQYKCPKCFQGFASAHNLKYHEKKVHPNKGDFKCRHCKESFNFIFDLKKHRSRAHPVITYQDNDSRVQLIQCPACNRRFARRSNLKRHYEQRHVRAAPVSTPNSKIFKCSLCEKSFKRKETLRRHIQSHTYEKKPYQCPQCCKYLADASSLHRHQRTIHGTKDSFECSECKKRFTYQHNLKRHKTTVHPVKITCSKDFYTFAKRLFECAECCKTFSREDILRHHVQRTHINPQNRPFKCAYCNATFTYKHSLRYHIQKRHLERTSNSKIFCCICKHSCDTSKLMQTHYMEEHDIKLEYDNFEFSNFDEFMDWKKELEKTTICRFLIVRNYKCESHMRYVYTCHRSGVYESKSTGRKRNVKLSGLKKLNGYCPAEIRVIKRNHDSNFRITFLKTHVGHAVSDETELRYVYLNDEERRALASKISAGVPLKRILNDSVSSAQNSETNHRLRILKLQDLHNISTSYNLKLSQSEADSKMPLSIDVFLKNYADSVLFYKPAGELDFRSGIFDEEDFVLIIMTELQQSMFHMYAQKVVAIYGPRETQTCDFYLHTVLVLDHENEGVAVAFALSNRNSVNVMDVFLSCIKDRVGIIQTDVLVSDLQDISYNSWIKIMCPPLHRFYCMWYVKKDWFQHLNKIDNKEKQKMVRQLLNQFMREDDVQSFNEKLNEFIKNDDPDLKKFIGFFLERYVPTANFWAQCNRRETGIASILQVDAFHKVVKYILGNGRKIGSLSNCLRTITDYITLKENDFKAKKIRNGVSHKFSALQKAHLKAIEQLEQYAVPVEMTDDNKWRVGSFSVDDTMYTIDKVMSSTCPSTEESCSLFCADCGSCYHQYQCACPDYTVQNNMCKHIHVLCIFLGNSGSTIECESPEHETITTYEFADSTPIIVTSETFEEQEERGETVVYATEEDPSAAALVATCEYDEEITPVIVGADIPSESREKSILADETQKLVEEFRNAIEGKATSLNDIDLIRSKFLKPMLPALLKTKKRTSTN